MKFFCEKEYNQQQILEIEKQRLELAQKRNELKKSVNGNNAEINELGEQISRLGNQSQELQNRIDFNCREAKSQVNLMIDNLVAEGIRKIRKINDEIQELENKITAQKERKAKYELQKHEFYIRFGRMPELSENAKRESKLQEKETLKNTFEIKKLQLQIKLIEEEVAEVVKIKKQFKNSNWKAIINAVEQIYIEEINVEGLEPIEEFYVEEFKPIEQLYVEEFQPVEEIHIEEFEENVEIGKQSTKTIVEEQNDEIEKIARAIVEEIAEEQAKIANMKQIEEKEEVVEDIISFEEKKEKKERIIIPLFGQKTVISNIIVKIEEAELVYKAQMSDEKEIKVYPSKLGKESVILRDKQNREECKEILINYAIDEHKTLDKKVVNKIDSLICELLIECAEEYGYDAQELIFNYAMSFSNTEEVDIENVPGIIYNLSYIEDSKLSKKEKAIIKKICKNARKNSKVEIIESFTGFRKIKNIFKKLFTVNNVKVLPEAKY